MLDDGSNGNLSQRGDGKAVAATIPETEDSGARAASAPMPRKEETMLQHVAMRGEHGHEDEERAEGEQLDALI